VSGGSNEVRIRVRRAGPAIVLAAALLAALGLGAFLGSSGFGLLAAKTPQTIYVVSEGQPTPAQPQSPTAPATATASLSGSSATATPTEPATPTATPRPSPTLPPTAQATPTPAPTLGPIPGYTLHITPTPTPTPYLPNLVMGPLNISSTHKCGTPFTVNAMVTNLGPATAPVTQVLVTDVLHGTTWTVGGDNSVGPLEYGRGVGVTVSVNINRGCGDNHVLVMEVDYLGHIAEISESDNRQHLSYTLGSP
jgi:hypothetical protein